MPGLGIQVHQAHKTDLGQRKAGKLAGVRGEEIQYSNNKSLLEDTLHFDDDVRGCSISV